MTLRAVIWVAVSSQAQADDEKTSLPEQERQARALAEQHGWRVVDLLSVPGHSRRYIDFHDVNRDMLVQGIDAFQRLLGHWEACDFDVLIVRDGSRFARSQSLHAYVVERTIQAGARIYSLADGWVDEQNHRMFIAMGGYSAAAQADHISRAQQAAKDRLAERGLWHNGRPPWFLKVIRNEYGKVLSMHVDRSYQRLYDDLAELLLAGVSWVNIEKELWKRGHGKNGRAFPRFAMYHIVYNPVWWGNSARNWNSINRPNRQKKDMWCFDPEFPAPPEVKIWYDTHEPVWDGDIAEAIKAELRRRRMSIRRAGRSHTFTGLLVCGRCGHYMVYKGKRGTYGRYGCQSRDVSRGVSAACDRLWSISGQKVKDYVDALLRRMLEVGALDVDLIGGQHASDDAAQRISQIKSEIESVENQTRTLIQKQAAAPDALHDLYDEQLAYLADQLTILRQNLIMAQSEAQKHAHNPEDQQRALEEIGEQGLEAFWQQPEPQINRVLHRLMGNRRFVVIDDIIGTTST